MSSNFKAKSDVQWYYQVMGAIYGPVNSEELRRLIDCGDIGRDTFVKPAWQDRWFTADRCDELLRSSA